MLNSSCSQENITLVSIKCGAQTRQERVTGNIGDIGSISTKCHKTIFFRVDRNHFKSFVNLDISSKCFLWEKRKEIKMKALLNIQRGRFVYFNST